MSTEKVTLAPPASNAGGVHDGPLAVWPIDASARPELGSVPLLPPWSSVAAGAFEEPSPPQCSPSETRSTALHSPMDAEERRRVVPSRCTRARLKAARLRSNRIQSRRRKATTGGAQQGERQRAGYTPHASRIRGLRPRGTREARDRTKEARDLSVERRYVPFTCRLRWDKSACPVKSARR
jgi:hypothetical protein